MKAIQIDSSNRSYMMMTTAQVKTSCLLRGDGVLKMLAAMRCSVSFASRNEGGSNGLNLEHASYS